MSIVNTLKKQVSHMFYGQHSFETQYLGADSYLYTKVCQECTVRVMKKSDLEHLHSALMYLQQERDNRDEWCCFPCRIVVEINCEILSSSMIDYLTREGYITTSSSASPSSGLAVAGDCQVREIHTTTDGVTAYARYEQCFCNTLLLSSIGMMYDDADTSLSQFVY